MAHYELYLYNIPKLSDDGQSEIRTEPSRGEKFESKADASDFARKNKDAFDRIVVMQVDSGGEKMVERFLDGVHESFGGGGG